MALDFEETDNPPITNGTGFLQGDPEAREPRVSQSPLSSARSSVIREFDNQGFTEDHTVRARQPAAKRRKFVPVDNDTMLTGAQIRGQQDDRSSILKPMSFLPKDPLLLALMTMQQNGTFVSSIMNRGNARGLAPQLRGLVSIEAVRKAGALKRKRDSGVADVGEDAEEPQPEAAVPAEVPPPDEGVADLSRNDKSTLLELPDDGVPPPLEDEPPAPRADDEELAPPTPGDPGAFDDTTAPLLHPDEQGPLSVGTQHAVHVLREHFGGDAAAASSQRPHAFFQDLYPEQRTTKAEATKMFFETLVLATKDAIKVDQAADALGGPIRIRPKRSLWGAWAEKEAGGEIAVEGQQGTAEAVAA